MELIKSAVKKHPYISVVYLWTAFFCIFGTFSISSVTLFNYLSAVVFTAGLIPVNELYLHRQGRNNAMPDKKKKTRFYVFICGLTVYLVGTLLAFHFVPANKLGWGRNPAVIFFAGLIFLAGAILYLRISKTFTENRIFLLLLVTGFFFHLFYSIYTEMNIQMDLSFLTSEDESGIMRGHMGYIKYLYQNFLPLQSDPRQYWQFYHPPLHHYLEAAFLRLQTFCGVDFNIAVYNIKYPPLLYYMLTIVTCIKIARKMNLKGTALLITAAIMLFSPGFLMISNYANNDMLSVFLMLHSVYLTILWYQEPKLVNIISIAAAFGLGMLSKLSAWMAAIPIAVIFLTALIHKLKEKNLKEFGRLVGQMSAFLLIAAPLSLYWSIRNYLRFGVPIAYIPAADNTYQHIDVSPVQRIFDFNIQQYKEPYVCEVYYSSYNEYNPLIALLKSASTNVAYAQKNFNLIFLIPNHLALWTGIILAAAALVCMIVILVKRNSISVPAKIVIAASYVVILASYYIFCVKYPDVCTENIRYASQLIYIGALSVGIVLQKLHDRKNRKYLFFRRFLITSSAVFCFASALLFSADGLWISLYYNLL